MGKNANLVEVVFKGERRAVYRNRAELDINKGDFVVVEAERGKEMGEVSLAGGLVRLKRGKGEAKNVIRIALPEDLKLYEDLKAKADEAFKTCHNKITEHKLDMKLVDAEVQFDSSKMTFFFTASQRIDFRELVKDLAALYRTRIELRQIGVRDEAKRIGGCGICGKKQCCSAFLEEFEQITTQMAKDQMLSLNPTKISGNCGRLLCCLRYEQDRYCEVSAHFPAMGSSVVIEGKTGLVNYINIFKELGQVRFEDGTFEWFPVETFKTGKRIEVVEHAEKTE